MACVTHSHAALHAQSNVASRFRATSITLYIYFVPPTYQENGLVKSPRRETRAFGLAGMFEGEAAPLSGVEVQTARAISALRLLIFFVNGVFN